jgi:hypothetical protein
MLEECKPEVKEEESSESPGSLPGDEELKSLLYSILESANLEELTKRAARRKLEDKLGRCPATWWIKLCVVVDVFTEFLIRSLGSCGTSMHDDHPEPQLHRNIQ